MKHNILSAHKIIGSIVGLIGFVLLFKYVGITVATSTMPLNLAGAWLALMTAIFGPLAGAFIAFFGHTIADLSVSGTAWWTWAIANGMFGLFIGLAMQRIGIFVGPLTTKKLGLFNVWQVIANIVAWLIIAPLGDHWIYGLALNAVYQQGALITVFNSVVIGLLGTGLIWLYQRVFIDRY